MKKTQNKNVLITGSSKGIGKSIAKVLSQTGYNVYICARNKTVLEQTALEVNASGYFCCDLTDNSALDPILSVDYDILVNNAGNYVYSLVEDMSDTDIARLLKLNFEVPYKLIRAVVPYMKKNKWGRIVNIGSISGVVGEAGASLYSMTKSAYNGLSKSLALELAMDNITVNTINPGWVETELAQDAVSQSDFSYQEEIEMIPQRRFICPDEIANLVKYIVSDEAKGLTGQSISLCAGLSAG